MKLPFNRKKISGIVYPDPNAASPTDGQKTKVDDQNSVYRNNDEYEPGPENSEKSIILPVIIGAIAVGILIYAFTD